MNFMVIGLLYGAIGNDYLYTGADHTYSQWQKVTNEELINKYLDIKKNNKSISNLETYLPPKPDSGYSARRAADYKDKNDGLYLLWVKRTGNECKNVFSCIVYDGLPDATTAEEYLGKETTGPVIDSIYMKGYDYFYNNESLDIKTDNLKGGDSAYFFIVFSEDIDITTNPKLKIKIGDGTEKTVETVELYKPNILRFRYNILTTDQGTINVIGLEGGNIKDKSGNSANLSITGTPIKGAIMITNDPTATVPVEAVTLSKNALTIEAGKTANLLATVKPTNATNQGVTWKSSDEKIAKVDSKGNVTAVAEGKATITVTTVEGAKTATCEVTVIKAGEKTEEKTVAVTGVKLDKTTATVEAGKNVQLTATVEPSNATDKTVTWKSSNEKIAKVDSTGKVTAVAEGKATITVATKDGGKTATCEVTVTKAKTNSDNTTKNTKDGLPDTGLNTGIVILIAFAVVSVIGYIKYRQYKEV